MAQITWKSIPRQPELSIGAGADTSLKLNARALLLPGLLGVLAAIFLLSLVLGSVNISLGDVIAALLGREVSRDTWATIILNHRLPKALTAVLAGAALGTSGLMMQTFFRNPLAGPFTLGITSGASLGAALVVLSLGSIGSTLLAGVTLGGDMLIALAAGTGAGLTMMLVLLLAQQVRSNTTLLILGLMAGYLTSALVSLLLYFSQPERIQAYINWTFGSFGGVTWNQMIIVAPLIIIGLMLALAMSKALNALLLGETYARSMGLHLRAVRTGIVLSTALLAGTVTAFCGPVGFVGIAVPHMCRALFNTSDHRLLMPATAIMGAIVALVAALIATLPGRDLVLPLNSVTALIGAPVVIAVVLRGRKGFSA